MEDRRGGDQDGELTSSASESAAVLSMAAKRIAARFATGSSP
jgi:hypothetical protein